MSEGTVVFEIIASAKGVKVVQKQTDDLARSSEKASKSTDKLSKSRDAYHRKEKGAAQISSNQTKNFSKMQQGIDGGGGSGGLVRAYALLAANVFALTAAFGVLSRSAQVDTLVESMEILSTTGGTYIKNLARNMQEASGFAVDLAQSMRQVSLASSAGLSTKEIEGLTQVAKGAAISLGRNLPDAMDRIFRGAIKLEPEILDEIGLFVRVDEASQKYARQLNKSATSLTQVEKRQAFLNEILDQGTKKFAEYADEIKPDPYVRLGAALGDIAQSGLSLLNSVLGPLLNFLAESQGALTAVFGVLVFSLIKKAIPALGQFNTRIAENAQQAAQNARDYTEGLKATTTAEVEETNKKLAEKKRLLESERKITGKGKGRASQAAAAKQVDKALKKELDGEKRLELLRKKEKLMEKQILASKEKQQKLLKQDLADMRVELSNLEQQERLTKQIADNEARGRIDPKKGSLSQLRQSKLDEKATSTTILAGVSNKAEQQGMKAGFNELNKELKENKKNLGAGSKAMTRFTGTASILGTGISRLMMILGPWMMLLSILSPLIFKLVKMMGFGSEEAKKLSKSLKLVSDQTENLGKRFDKQIKSFNDGTLSYREQNKALLAYNKSQQETLKNIQLLQKDLEAFEKQLGFFTGGWEILKSAFGLSFEQKTLKQQTKGMRESVIAAFNMDDKVLMKGFKEAIPDTVDLEKALANVGAAREALNKINLRAIPIDEKNNRTIDDSMRAYSKESDVIIDAAVKEGMLLESHAKVAKLNNAVRKSIDERKEATDNFTPSEEQLAAAAEGANKVLEQRVQIYAAMESALEGAQESISKFQQSFRAKTKVDEVLSSFRQLTATLDGIDSLNPEQVTKFFKKFDNTDNPFNKLLKGVKKDEQSYRDAIKKIMDDLEEFRVVAITAATNIKSLTAESKDFQKVFTTGAVKGIEIEHKLTQAKKEQEKIATANTKVLLISLGIDKERLKEAYAAIKAADTKLDKEAAMAEYGLDELDMLAVQNSLTAEEIKQTETALAIATQVSRGKKRELELDLQILNVEKELKNVLEQRATAQAKLSSLQKRGTLDIRPEEEAKLAIEAASTKLKMTVSEAKIKFSIMQMEREILKEEFRVLHERKKAKDGVGFADFDETMANFNNNPLFSGEALKNTIALASETFRIEVAQAVEKGFGGGVLAGIKTSQAAFKEQTKQNAIDREKAITEARAKQTALNTAEGVGALDGMSSVDAAGQAAGEDFDKAVAAERGLQMFRSTATAMSEQLKELGPQGALIASVVQGAMVIGDAWSYAAETMSGGGNAMEKGAAVAAAAAQTIGQIGQMMAANSKAQIAEVDQQIAAEKRRDGKSKESVAKMKALEKKKDAINRKAFEQQKKMQIATTIASTAASIMQVMSAPGDPYKAFGIPMSIMLGALGAAQVAIIARQKYNGGSAGDIPAPATKLSIGKRSNSVDVSRGSSAGELSYLRGERGVGSNANNFTPGGAMGRKGYASGGEGILVGERGPEVVTPSQPVDVIPNDKLGGNTNVNFSINAVDAAGVEDLLVNQRGNIIRMIREAANDTGERFLETVDTQAYGSST